MISKSNRPLLLTMEKYTILMKLKELKNKYEFTTLTDTEVILNSFEAWYRGH